MAKAYDWSQVDWHKTNAQISDELGCTRSAVAMRRRHNGFPANEAEPHVRILAAARARAAYEPGMTARQLGEKLGVAQHTAAQYAWSAGLELVHGRVVHDWLNVNWGEPNVAIAKRLGATASTVSRARRRYAPDELKLLPAGRPKSTA